MKDLIKHGLKDALVAYKGQVNTLIKDSFPEYNWKGWCFQNISKAFWEDHGNQREFMNYLAEELKIDQTDDWYRIKASVIKLI